MVMEPTKSKSARLTAFVSQTIAFETGGDKSGAYHSDPKDTGGETKWGISKRAHPNENIKALTYQDALRIYEAQYWNEYYNFIADERIAFKLFDMGVLSGKTKAVELLQKSIRNLGVTIATDGNFGPMSLTATNMQISDKLYTEYINEYNKYFNKITWFRPKNKRFLSGWLRRLNWAWGGDNKEW